jgi:hypothetical protein
MVTRRQGRSSAVEAAARKHAGEVARRLAPRFAGTGSDGEGEAVLGLLQERLERILRADREALEAADRAHIEELREDGEARRRRDAAVALVYSHVSRLRGMVETLFGAGAGARVFALRGETSRNPQVLRRQAERVVARLRDTAEPLPGPMLAGVAVDPEDWAAGIEPALGELKAALPQVDHDRRQAEATLCRKREALERHDRTYAAVTSILSGLYRLAELDHYDRRLRPTTPRSARGGNERPPLAPPAEAVAPAAGELATAAAATAPAAPDRAISAANVRGAAAADVVPPPSAPSAAASEPTGPSPAVCAAARDAADPSPALSAAAPGAAVPSPVASAGATEALGHPCLGSTAAANASARRKSRSRVVSWRRRIVQSRSARSRAAGRGGSPASPAAGRGFHTATSSSGLRSRSGTVASGAG